MSYLIWLNMQQTELFPVPNPCVGVCQSNAKGYCMGCLRSRTERQKWKDLMPVEKMRVIELCDLRRAKLEAMLKAKKEKEALLASGADIQKERVPSKPESTKTAPLPIEGSGQEGSLDLF